MSTMVSVVCAPNGALSANDIERGAANHREVILHPLARAIDHRYKSDGLVGPVRFPFLALRSGSC
jgi:hypothetical protein